MNLSFLQPKQQESLSLFLQLKAAERRTRNGLAQFNEFLFSYFKNQGRVLPWRSVITPYTTFISEVMLQQTQVDRVIDKYTAFIAVFPSFDVLAAASPTEVLRLWQGLGYNRRALFLHRAAKIIVQQYNAVLPDDPEQLMKLPGIGTATAASITAFAFNKPTVFLETNVRTVFIYFFFPRKKVVADEELLALVKKTVPADNACDWYSAIMDLGSDLKKCIGNQTRRSKTYTTQSTFHGSDRQIRGKILRLLLRKGTMSFESIIQELKEPAKRVFSILIGLEKDGLVVLKGQVYSLPQ